ncbi:hypothetical protein MRX96_051479 [Rhipicephalus microplus]
MKFLSVRKVTQGTALAVSLVAFYGALLLLGWPPLGIDWQQQTTALVADDAAQDGGAHKKADAGGGNDIDNEVEDYADQPSGEDFDADSVDVRDSNRSADQGAAVSGGAAPEEPQRSPTTRLEDVFFSVKTTRTFHRTRLDVILKTWFVLAREQGERCKGTLRHFRAALGQLPLVLFSLRIKGVCPDLKIAGAERPF